MAQGKFGFIDDLAPPELRRKRSSVYDAYLKQLMSFDTGVVERSGTASVPLSLQPRRLSTSLHDLSRLPASTAPQARPEPARDAPGRSASLLKRITNSLHRKKPEPAPDGP